MTPRDVLIQVESAGHRLNLRPGGLRLICAGDPQPELLELIREHRASLLSLLEAEKSALAAHQASLDAGRITTPPKHLLNLVHPPLQSIASIS